jgi:hypothetical protein
VEGRRRAWTGAVMSLAQRAPASSTRVSGSRPTILRGSQVGFSNFSSSAQFYAYVTDVLMFGFSNPIFGLRILSLLSPDRQKSDQIFVEQMFCSMMVQNKDF